MQSTGDLLHVRTGEVIGADAPLRTREPRADTQNSLGSQERTAGVRVLVDLKPALDGYAGIPQETRLLFGGLRKLPRLNVDGLIQHGSRVLKAAISSRARKLTAAQRINRLSRTIVSMHQRPYSGALHPAREQVDLFINVARLWFRLKLGLALQLRSFEPKLFGDFLWRTLFSNSLEPPEKVLVTSGGFRVLTWSRKLLHQVGLSGLRFSSSPNYARVDTTGYDVLLAQTPFPGRVSGSTALVIRYHDAVPVLMPHVIGDKAFHQASHFYALQDNVRQGAWFCCVSEATRSDLLQIFPEAAARAVVIPNIVSSQYFEDASSKWLVFHIILNRLGKSKEFISKVGNIERDYGTDSADAFQYLLMVSTIEPRKNHLLLLQAWERLKYTSAPKLKLVVVGAVGWDSEGILKAFRPWAERGELIYLNNVPASELRVLYKHAAATVCPSLAEGFDYTGLEAMRCGGIVISSDIPVHREIYENASEYFDPYSADDATSVMDRVLAEDATALRLKLKERGALISARYSEAAILPKWDQFFQDVGGAN